MGRLLDRNAEEDMIDELGAFCAYCIVPLPKPAVWKWPHPENLSTKEVTSWNGALQAHAEGYRYHDDNFVAYGLYAVTWVGGTALCFSHGYFKAMKELEFHD